MPVHAKKQKEMASRQSEISRYYLQGKTQLEIADLLSCSVGTVNRDLQILNKRWLESAQADINARKARELAKLDRLEGQAWESFFLSNRVIEKGQGKRKTPSAKSGGRDKESFNQFVKEVETAGDPRFLNIVADCIERRCRIIGIDAPGKIEVTGSEGKPIEYRDRSKIAIHQLAELLKNQGVSLTESDETDDDPGI